MHQKSVDSVRLQDMAYAYRHSAALMSAVELGLFTGVSKGSEPSPVGGEGARRGGPQRRAADDGVTAMELLERDGERFRNAPDVERFLVQGKPTYAGPWMLQHRGRLGWLGRSEKLRRTSSRYWACTTPSSPWRRRDAARGDLFRRHGAARRFHRQVDLSGRKRIMDIGGGSGCYCIVAAQTYPAIRAVVLDLAPVVEVTRDFIAQNGVQDRVEAQPCDFTSDPFPVDCDVAIMASNLPQYSREIIAGVLQIYDALLPGGEFHLIGEMLDDDRRGRRRRRCGASRKRSTAPPASPNTKGDVTATCRPPASRTSAPTSSSPARSPA